MQTVHFYLFGKGQKPKLWGEQILAVSNWLQTNSYAKRAIGQMIE